MKLLALFALCFVTLSANPVMVTVASKEDAYTKAHELLKDCTWEGAYVRPIQATYSMFPVIDQGCLVIVAKKPFALVATGDIVSSVRNRPFEVYTAALHRVRSVKVTSGKKAYVMKGDNNPRADWGWFVEADYQGTVFAIIRFETVPQKTSTSLDSLNRWGK